MIYPRGIKRKRSMNDVGSSESDEESIETSAAEEPVPDSVDTSSGSDLDEDGAGLESVTPGASLTAVNQPHVLLLSEDTSSIDSDQQSIDDSETDAQPLPVSTAATTFQPRPGSSFTAINRPSTPIAKDYESRDITSSVPDDVDSDSGDDSDILPTLESGADIQSPDSSGLSSTHTPKQNINEENLARDTESNDEDIGSSDSTPTYSEFHDRVLESAARLPVKDNDYDDETSSTDSSEHYLLGPPALHGTGENTFDPHNLSSRISKSVLLRTPSPPPSATDSTPPFSPALRPMTTSTRTPSRAQKLFHGYPAPTAPYPADWTLTELCQRYPNHVIGDNLHPFLRHGWDARRIFDVLPDQAHVAAGARVTRSAVAARLRKARTDLEKAGRYQDLMAAEAGHQER